MPIRLLAALVIPVFAGATDLSTALEVGAHNPLGGTMSYEWSTLSSPVGAEQPVFTVEGWSTPGITHRVRAVLPNAQIGFYRFQVVIHNAGGQISSEPITVEVRNSLTNTGPIVAIQEPDAGGSGGSGGCGGGTAVAMVLGCLAFVGRGRRTT